MVAKPPVVAWKGQGRVLFRWLCWLCSACLRLFVGVVWLVFVGGLGGIATIGAALRRVAGVSVVYGRKTPRVVARKGQRRVPVEGSMVAKPPSACSKCSRPRWNGGDMGLLGCSGRRFGRAGSWRGVFCGAACRVPRASVRAAGMIEPTVGAWVAVWRGREAHLGVLVTYFCAVAGGGAAAYGQVFLRRDRLGIVCSCARWDHRPHCRSGSPDAAFPQPLKVFTSAPYTSGGASWQSHSCVVVVS